MMFPDLIYQDEVEHYVALWKLSGLEVTLYHNDEEETEHVVGKEDFLLFVQSPLGEFEAVLEELYLAVDGGYMIFRAERASKPGTVLPRITAPTNNQFEVRL